MNVRIEECTQDDLMESYLFYEDCEPGVGEYFLVKIREEILELQVTGGVHRLRYGFHFCPSRRFPHGIYYRISGEMVKVYAVLDCRRNPRWIRQQLKGR